MSIFTEQPFDAEECIRLLRQAQNGRTLQGFARDAQLSPGNLSRVLHGQRATPETLRRIAAVSPTVSYHELMAAMGYTKEAAPVLHEPAASPAANIMLLPLVEAVHGSAKKLKNSRKYPLIPYPLRTDGDYILFLANDDAFLPRFGPGAQVLVDLTREPQDGEIALVLLDKTESLLRRVAKSGARFQLYSDNATIMPENIAKSRLVFYGVAVAVTSEL